MAGSAACVVRKAADGEPVARAGRALGDGKLDTRPGPRDQGGLRGEIRHALPRSGAGATGRAEAAVIPCGAASARRLRGARR
jgi:hypothetical protein